MSEYLGPLLTSQDEIKKAVRQRKKKVIEDTIKANTPELLEEKLTAKMEEGWTVLRPNKASYRISHDKSLDEQLEDEMWCILAQMQFKEMSDGRLFKIQPFQETEPQQIDVFAKDDETAIFVTCVYQDTPGKKSMTKRIEKIESLREKISMSLHSHYGRKPKLKQGWVIATRNLEWSQTDLDKAQSANITVLRDTELNYYVKFTRLYKLAAKYQLLAHLFANEKILGLELVVPATKGNMGGVDFYNFLIKPADLLKISHVSHKASRDVQDIETYQRLLNPNRLKEIAQYIDDGGQFPTNIVVNVRTKKKKKLRFEKIDNIGESAFGRLFLPNQYASAMVIDGQHRLYGYAHSERIVNGKEGKATVPVLAYENLEPTKEAKLFVDINCEQVRVPRNLLNEINATLYWDSDDFKLQVDALCSRMVMTLNTKQSSPVYDRVILTNRDMTYLRCLTLTNFFDGLKENKFFGEQKKSGVISAGPLTDSSSNNLEDTMKKAIKVIDGYLNFFAKTAPHHWDLGKIKKEKESQIGYLATNEGVRALFRVLKELLIHIEIQTGRDADTLSGEELLKELEKYAIPIAEIFKIANYEAIAQFRSRSASKKAVLENAYHLMGFIHKQYPEFCPHGLEEYLESIDEEGTKEAEGLVAELQKQMYEFVLYKLKEKYPNDDDWWYEGVPSKVRTQCTARCEEEKGIKSKEQYLKLIDYHSIAMSNWQGCFQGSFSFTKDGGKDKQLNWIKQLNSIRNITHHPEKWPASKKQVEFVRDIHKKGMERFVIPESSSH